tara:strand:+ start:61 stop:477 length:417 start_codon:yes stop_codon:yes gene_type:complete
LIPLIAQGLFCLLQARTLPCSVLGNGSLPDAIPILAQLAGVDDMTLMAHYWAVEFAEFDGFTRKTSAERLKAFTSRTTDICRRKYGKGTERIPRRSVFWGTANRSPLTDRTVSTWFCLIDLPDKKLPLARVSLDRDAF